ncbi:uncharacterized protein LOC134274264 [Saccostrea cucullata]|uniref:uncharacterized protein LOC134274264 n=1 Tax=Saccostrea cuccullata TaxID=36930 RepID=UPI002ED3208D
MLMFSQYLSILVAVASLMYAAGERNKISDVLNTPVESYFNGIGYKCTMLGLTSFAVVLMVITLACFISQNSKKGKNHILDLKEKDQGTLKLDSIPDRREKKVTNVKEMKDNEKDTEEPK